MRKITMTEKRHITEAVILASIESIGITKHGRLVCVIAPDWQAVVEHKAKLAQRRKRKCRRARTNRRQA